MTETPRTETELRKKFVAMLRKCNAVVVPYVGSTMGASGTADVFVAHKHWSGWVEFKGPSTKIRLIQKKFRDDMRERGVNAFIIRLHDTSAMSFEDDDPIWWMWGRDAYQVLATLKLMQENLNVKVQEEIRPSS